MPMVPPTERRIQPIESLDEEDLDLLYPRAQCYWPDRSKVREFPDVGIEPVFAVS